MKKSYLTIVCTLVIALSAAPHGYAGQSSITEADGYSCMGVDKSRKDTETAALQDAKRNAVEFSKTYIESESQIENFELKKDLVNAFSKANVKVLTVLEQKWQDPSEGDCYTIRIKAEVIPEKEDMDRVAASNNSLDDPTAPLAIKIWTSQPSYTAGESMKIYLKGNKPFYGRLIYTDAQNNPLQLLPNPYRTDNYFQGGVIYEVPTGTDKFDLTVQPPYGTEKLTLYGSTSPLGTIDTASAGSVYKVTEKAQDVAVKTRGIAINVGNSPVAASSTGAPPAPTREKIAEFDEATVSVTTQGGES